MLSIKSSVERMPPRSISLSANLTRSQCIPHRFLEPIHNVKEATRQMRAANIPRLFAADLMILITGCTRERHTPSFAQSANDGGAYRDRTDDLMLAKQPLSQLS
jgi:hypothetical protein